MSQSYYLQLSYKELFPGMNHVLANPIILQHGIEEVATSVNALIAVHRWRLG